MSPSTGKDSSTHALIERPTLALVAKGEGQAQPVGPDAGPSREARIREAAYARYEARGHAHGHDLDDWLAAEAAFDGEFSADEASAAPSSH